MKKIINNVFGILCVIVLLGAVSCQKEWEAELSGEAPRIFRPVIKGSLEAAGNYIDVAWQKSEETTKYKVEVSIDSFKTIAASKEVADTTGTAVEELLWEQLYQVRVTALHPSDPAKNSRPAEFGEVKTPRFPTIVETPTTDDIGITSIVFRWRNEGEPVTKLKLFKVDLDTEQETELRAINLSSDDIQQTFKLVDQLSASTTYRIALYSGETYRGANTYTTKEAISGNIIDLQASDPSSVNLGEVVADAPAGSTILLKKGATYEITSSLTFSKSVTLMGGIDPLIPQKSKVSISGISNFGITSGANIESLIFKNLELYTNDGGGKYIFNPNSAGNIENMTFEDCIIHDVRGVSRFRGGMKIGHERFENCMVFNIGGYGVVTVDDANASVDNFTFANSTLYNADLFVVSKNNATGTYTLTTSTFYHAPQSGRYLFDFGGTTFSASGGIVVTNMVFGQGKPTAGTDPTYDIQGIRSGGTQLTSGNNYVTSDFKWRESTSAIIPSVSTYSKSSTDIFAAPASGNFTIKDNGFPGKDSAGDPRWRP
ncbi:DUF4957 domain-containing protein [Sphingobacterium suaedae]|uniref:DUF4957 domain-containing protein n=1 Tax=Sphingobacterium suaedae TaxID=1686402 RepID=A0ABW5KFS8_9SPHI